MHVSSINEYIVASLINLHLFGITYDMQTTVHFLSLLTNTVLLLTSLRNPEHAECVCTTGEKKLIQFVLLHQLKCASLHVHFLFQKQPFSLNRGGCFDQHFRGMKKAFTPYCIWCAMLFKHICTYVCRCFCFTSVFFV